MSSLRTGRSRETSPSLASCKIGLPRAPKVGYDRLGHQQTSLVSTVRCTFHMPLLRPHSSSSSSLLVQHSSILFVAVIKEDFPADRRLALLGSAFLLL